MYQTLVTSQDNDEVHRIVNEFIFKWFPKERELEESKDEETAEAH